MNNESDERMVERFFSENRMKIEDDGFTHRVMRSLPSRTMRLNRLWTACCTAAAVLLLLTDNVQAWLSGTMRGLIADITTSSVATQSPLMTVLLLTTTATVLSTIALVRELR